MKKYLLITVNDEREITTNVFQNLDEARHYMSEEWNEVLSQYGYEDDDDVEDAELCELFAYIDNECGQYNWKIIEIC